MLWSTIGINKFEGSVATDLKLANILIGIMGHSSIHPCTWCIAEKSNLHERAELRTIGNISDSFAAWQAAKSKQKDAKQYNNCIHLPVFAGDSNKLILDIIPPPELHLLLGVVNTIFNHMLQDFNQETLDWAKSCLVERNVTHGGSSFNINLCKKLFEKIYVLRSKCPIACLKYVKALEDFHLVVKACFSQTLQPNFKECIANFRKSYSDLEISITPKVHAVFFHVEDFCVKNKQALGFFSEQAMESVHFDFNSVWSKYMVHVQNPQYMNSLLNAVCEFNGLHI